MMGCGEMENWHSDQERVKVSDMIEMADEYFHIMVQSSKL